jgi:hypothetical protein
MSLPLFVGSVTTVPAPAMNSTVAASFTASVTDNVVRLRVNYKFDPSDAIWTKD